jgi:cytochrome c peroxidase
MALEGHCQLVDAPKGLTGGYSYHLGNDENYVPVVLRQEVKLTDNTEITLQLDVAKLLAKVDITKDGDSTHSRTQDAPVVAIKQALQSAFSITLDHLDEGKNSTDLAAANQNPPLQGKTLYPISVGAHLPTVSFPKDNPPTVPGVALGKALFHDTRLSKDQTLACASCHHQQFAFADPGKAFSAGVNGSLGGRNAMPIFNLAWGTEFFWDGRAKGLRHQALMPIQDAHEMAETLPEVVRKLKLDASVTAMFADAFGSKEVTAEKIGLALEQFMLTLISQDSKFDKVMSGQGKFSEEEKRGFELFLTEHDPLRGLFGADCFHCHGGPLFTNNHFMNIGLPSQGKMDSGRAKVTGDAADHNKFRTPSLRNIALTGPYMHDGRFETLEQVIDHYDHGVERSATLDPNLAKHPAEGLKLKPEDKAALVAFLKTLTDPAFTKHQEAQ